MIFNYPNYIRSNHAKRLFRLAVLHRIMAEDNPSEKRTRDHFFYSGWNGGRLRQSKDTLFIKSFETDIYKEARRIYLSLQSN